MNFGPSTVSNRRPNAETSDAEALEKENDQELQDLSNKAAYLRQVTIGIRDDVEEQNRLISSVDDGVTSVRTGLSGVVGRFKSVMETRHGTRYAVGIGVGTLLLLWAIWLLLH